MNAIQWNSLQRQDKQSITIYTEHHIEQKKLDTAHMLDDSMHVRLCCPPPAAASQGTGWREHGALGLVL